MMASIYQSKTVTSIITNMIVYSKVDFSSQRLSIKNFKFVRTHKHTPMTTRRKFVKQTAIAGTGIALAPQLSFASSSNSAKEKLNVGLIGVGLRGTNHLNNCLLRDDVNVVAICDIDERRLPIALEMIAKAGQKKPAVFSKSELDYRNLLLLSEVDAVIISTPKWPKTPCWLVNIQD